MGNLLHDGRFADAGRPHQEDGPLLLDGDAVVTELVLGEIRPHGDLDLVFGLFDVQGGSPDNQLLLIISPSFCIQAALL